MRTVCGCFDDRDKANEAIMRLSQENLVDLPNTKLIDHKSSPGFWGAIRELMGQEESHEHDEYFAEGVRRGDVLVTCKVDDPQAELVQKRMRELGALDDDRHERYLREQGFDHFDERAQVYTPDETRKYRSEYADWERGRHA